MTYRRSSNPSARKTVMPFDSAAYPMPQTAAGAAALIDAAEAPCPVWTAQNPDRALAFLFVAPSDCAAVDVLLSL
jgi:hypothetical protein